MSETTVTQDTTTEYYDHPFITEEIIKEVRKERKALRRERKELRAIQRYIETIGDDELICLDSGTL